MKENRLFFFALIFISFALISIPASSQEFMGDMPVDYQPAMNLLQSEIARDQSIIKFGMNIVRLRQTRKQLAGGIQLKEQLLEWFAEPGSQQFPLVVDTLQSTLQDEKDIVGSGRTTKRTRRLTYNRLKENIPLKQKALSVLSGH